MVYKEALTLDDQKKEQEEQAAKAKAQEEAEAKKQEEEKAAKAAAAAGQARQARCCSHTSQARSLICKHAAGAVDVPKRPACKLTRR